jgi:excisionase family DNA binding protein
MTTTMIPAGVPDPFEVPTLSVDAAAALAKVSRSTYYRGIERDEMPYFRVGRRLRVPTAKLYQLLGWLPEPTD